MSIAQLRNSNELMCFLSLLSVLDRTIQELNIQLKKR